MDPPVNYCSDNKHYILWVRSHCPWCQKAIDFLAGKSLSYVAFDLDEKPETLLEAKGNLKWETVPIIFEIKNDGAFKLIGGYTDLEQYLEAQE